MKLEVIFVFLKIHVVVFLVCCLGNETDKLALLDIKAKITHDPLQVMSSWNETTPFCQWPGVTCGSRHQRVTLLSLRSLQLQGSISPFVGNLTFLRGLSLHNNSFGHEIPPEISRLRRLRVLILDHNAIGGEIPTNLSACTELFHVDLGFNRLAGKIPEGLGSLTKLKVLILQANQLMGEITPLFKNTSFLEEFIVADNFMEGRIPDVLGQMMNLKILGLGENGFSGTIPLSIFNLTSLQVFDVVVCQLRGSLPSDIGNNLPNLQYLGVGGNHFTGSVPVSISNATNLETLGLEDNKFTGQVPTLQRLHKLSWLSLTANQLGSGKAGDLSFFSSMINATSLEFLALNANNFGGELPESIGNFSALVQLYLDENQFYGSIPIGIWNLINLDIIHLWDNQLTGEIPLQIGFLQNLEELDLSQNKLSGNIPSSINNLTLLTKLDLSENNLRGSIPSVLGECRNLIFLTLAHNNLSGAIPREVISLSSLSVMLNLSRNQLEGHIPNEVGRLKNLGELDVSENMLSGKIPNSLGDCVRLETLNLEGNFFQGSIPSSFVSLRGIQVLDLSRNNLSGKIPEFCAEFRFVWNLNLSYNDFEGEVPTRKIFTNASAITIAGNNKLCGGIPELMLPKCKSSSKGSKKIRPSTHILTLIIIISIVCGLLVLLSVLCFTYFFCFKRKRKEVSASLPDNSIMRMSYQSLLKATDGFSSAHLIGVGSFGSVYRGILDDDGGTIVAVKVLNLLRRGATKSFIAECETLRSIRHRNLVKVLTACSGVDYQGNDFKALVYEFMANRSLEEWLHPKEDATTTQKLDFLQRINIAIDVASALDYLHHHCETPIVHCDLKPSNVLLDNEMSGHVSDFGLAKFLYESNHDFFATQSSSIGVRGSIGYTAPEYGMGSEVSTSGDVYSFGILLLEMFTAKRPTDDMLKEGLDLRGFVNAALSEGAMDIADPTLLLQETEEEEEAADNLQTIATNHQSSTGSNKFHECLTPILRIGLACSEELPRERMNIADVIAELHSIRHLFQRGNAKQ